MLRRIPVRFDASITLRSDDSQCYLESQGINEPPSSRHDRSLSTPLLSFERCVFRFDRSESSIVDRVSREVMVYGSTVRVVSPATMLVACVVRTETASRAKGFRVVMRPQEAATAQSSIFRLVSQMRSRSGADYIMNGDHVILQLENSDLYLVATESVDGGVEIIACPEPRTWGLRVFDEGYNAHTSGLAFASRVIAIEHRYHRSHLTRGTPVKPHEHRHAAARRSLWHTDDAIEGPVELLADVSAEGVAESQTSNVYFESVAISVDESSSLASRFHCSCTSLWICENLDPTIGGPLKVGSSYRIRHLASGEYLTLAEAAPGRYEVTTLSDVAPDMLSRTTFQVDSNADDDKGHISSYHSFVRLRHIETGLWLSSNAQIEFSIAAATGSRRPVAHDRISLRHPSELVVNKMLLLVNHMKFLREHVSTFAKLYSVAPLSNSRIANDADIRQTAERTRETLQSLFKFCISSDIAPSATQSTRASRTVLDAAEITKDAMPNKEHQRMLIELQIPQLILDVLTAPFTTETRTLHHKTQSMLCGTNTFLSLFDVSDAMFHHVMRVHTTGQMLLQYIAKGSVAGSNTIASYYSLFILFEKHNMKSADLLQTALESCTALSESQEVEIAESLVELLRKNVHKASSQSFVHNGTYLQCIASLQKARARVAFLVKEFEGELLYGMSSSIGRMMISIPSPQRAAAPDGGDTMATLLDSGGEVTAFEIFIAHGEREKIVNFISSVKLLVRLAPKDRDSALFHFVTQRISREQVIHVLKYGLFSRDIAMAQTSDVVGGSQLNDMGAGNQNSMHIIQSIFVEAAIQLYLAPRLDLQSHAMVPVVASDVAFMSDVSAVGGHSKQHSELENQADATFIRQIKSSAMDVLKMNTVQVMQNKGKNALISKCVQVVGLMLKHRLTPASEINEVIPILVAILDGRTDIYSSRVSDIVWNRYELTDHASVIVETKINVCDVLSEFVDSVVSDCVAYVATAVASKSSPADILEDVTTRLHSCQALLRYEELCAVLLDLVLYQSNDLANRATNLLTKLTKLMMLCETKIADLLVLPQSLTKFYGAVVQQCGHIEARIRSGNSDTLWAAEIRRLVGMIQKHSNDIVASGQRGGGLADESYEAAALRAQQIADQDTFLILSVVGKMEIDQLILAALPSQPGEELDACVEFFSLVVSVPANAKRLANHWPTFFQLLLQFESSQQAVLSILEHLLPFGNKVAPLSRGDLKVIMRIFARERYPVCISTLRSMMTGVVARPNQQRDIITMLSETGMLVENCWFNLPIVLVEELVGLLVLCCEGNAFVQAHLQRIFTADSTLTFLQSIQRGKSRLKTTVVRFLSTVFMKEPAVSMTGEEKKAQRHASSSATQLSTNSTWWTLNEVWWRVVRDDFTARFDEISTMVGVRRGIGKSLASGSIAESSRLQGRRQRAGDDRSDRLEWSRYAMECAQCVESFFANRFNLQQAVNVDWVAKEVRSFASSVTQLFLMSSQLDLTETEFLTLLAMGSTVTRALTGFSDAIIPRLMASVDEATSAQRAKQIAQSKQSVFDETDSAVDGSNSAGTLIRRDDASPRDEQFEVSLSTFSKLLTTKVTEDVQWRTAVVTQQLLPENLNDRQDLRRKIIEKLLRLCGHQKLEPEAIVFILECFERCVMAFPDDSPMFVAVQEAFGECRALQVATLLIDATDKRISWCALRLGIAALLGGNTVNQNNFLNYFTSNDEKFFISSKKMLEDCSLEIMHMRKERHSVVVSASDRYSLARDGIVFFCCEPLLRLIQLLCEGHHFQLQEYCREQKDNLRSVNAVQMCVGFLTSLVEGQITDDVVDITLQTLNNLTEFCQGPCSGNQAMLVSSEVIASVETLLRGVDVPTSIKRAAVTTLVSLVEGCTDAHVGESIVRQLSLSTLEALYNGDLHSKDEDAVELIFDIGIFLRSIADLLTSSTISQLSIRHSIHNILRSRSDIGKQTGRIQIQRDDELELVYFRIPANCQNIRQDSKEALMWEIDRSSQSAKHSSFYDLCEGLIMEMDLVTMLEAEVHEWTAKIPFPRIRNFVRGNFHPSQRTWIVNSVVLAFLSNALLMLDITNPFVHVVIGVFQAVLCTFIVILDWKIAGTVYLHKRRRRKERMRVIRGEDAATDHDYSRSITHISPARAGKQMFQSLALTLLIRFATFAFGPKRVHTAVAALQGLRSDVEVTDEDSSYAKNVTEALLKVRRSSFMAVVFMCATAFLGLFLSPTFFVVHLFWCVSLSPSLQNVIAAITLNRRTLAVTLFLGMLVCYAFSIVGFSLFPEHFDTDADDSTRDNCSSLLHCFVYIATTGLRQGGGVGDVMKGVPWGAEHFVSRRVFDFVYFCIMIVVFLNILFGIIIDTFAELRDAKHDKENDMKFKCFVCGLSSHVFDQFGDGFAHHTEVEHNMWQYLYFVQHLRLKDPNDYTGQESYVALKLKRKDFSFFPKRSLALERKLRQAAEESSKLSRRGGESNARESAGGSTSMWSSLLLESGATDVETRGGHSSEALSALPAVLQAIRTDLHATNEELRLVMRHAGGKSSNRQGGDQLYSNSNAQSPLVLSAGEFKSGESVAVQTMFSESVVDMEHQLRSSRAEGAGHLSELNRLKDELRHQHDEIRRLTLHHHNIHELQLANTTAKQEVRDMTKQLDSAMVEKDAVVRQNIFLQREVERLVLENAQLNAAARTMISKSRVEESFRQGTTDDSNSTIASGSGVRGMNTASVLAEQLLHRSRKYESMALEDPNQPSTYRSLSGL